MKALIITLIIVFFIGFTIGIVCERNQAMDGEGQDAPSIKESHICPAPTRQAIQLHWIEVHDANHKIANTLDSKMLDTCSRECDYGYWEDMEENERNIK